MRKSFALLLACLLLLLLAACGGGAASSPASSEADQDRALSSPDGREKKPRASSASPASPSAEAEAPPASAGSTVEKSFGSFTLPAGWSESEELSRSDIFFYLQDGTSTEKPTSNISVNEGTNKYSEDDYGTFARAIMQQVGAQLGPDVTQVTGDGTVTETGIPLIIITVEQDDLLTVQYYIVGDYRHIMVQMSDFYDEQVPDVQEVALSMVDSFVWAG